MKKTAKKLLMLLILMIVVAIIPINAYAFTATINIIPEKTQVTAGETIELAIKLSDIADLGADGGINAIGGTISYDKDFFEEITGFLSLNEETGKFAIMSTSDKGVTTDSETFAVIKAKVKSDAKGNGYIKFTDLSSANGGDTEVASADVSLDFTIENNSDDGNNTGNNTDDNTDNNTDNDTGNNIGNNTDNTYDGDNLIGGNKTLNSVGGNSDKTLASKIIPATGIKAGIVILTGIVLIMGISSYALYRRYKNI